MRGRAKEGLAGVNVVPFGRATTRPPDVQPQLSNQELADIRDMLREHAIIKEGCPMARRLLDPD